MNNKQTLKDKYIDLLYKKIQKYAQEKYLEVLVCTFVDSNYMALCQDIKENKRYVLIIDNIEKPLYIEINTFLSPDNYHVCNLCQLSNNLPNKYLKKLMDRGLYMKIKSKRNKNTSKFAIHRLVCCIGYQNIKNKTIHHIDKNKANNNINNLVPISSDLNRGLDNNIQDNKTFILAGKMFRDIVIEDIKEEQNKKRNTITKNEYLHKDIITYRKTHTTKETINRYRNKIKTKQTIRDIVNYYYYLINNKQPCII